VADNAVRVGRSRPKPRKLEEGSALYDEVARLLGKRLSPEQVAGRLRREYAEDPEMWVSHETIYQALYAQPRGALRREVGAALRTGRISRKPHGRNTTTRGQLKDMVMVSERPAEAQDRAVPGHWEGDLILGAGNRSAIGTLVERTTGFVMLLHLPGDHTAETVAAAMTAAIPNIPDILQQSLTWDQGREMALHTKITAATGLPIYFCDPHSPWQRATNENTNGLLRQYFPKGSDLSFFRSRNARQRRRRTQRPAPQTPQLDDPSRETRRTTRLSTDRFCCRDRLNPPRPLNEKQRPVDGLPPPHHPPHTGTSTFTVGSSTNG
jgi:IS30 family transposase